MKIRLATNEELPDGSKIADWLDEKTLTRKFYKTKYKPEEIPESIEIPLYVNYVIKGSESNKLVISSNSNRLNNDLPLTDLNLGRFVVTVPLPKVHTDDCLNILITSLKRERQELMAKHQKELSEIEDRIQNLLAIPAS